MIMDQPDEADGPDEPSDDYESPFPIHHAWIAENCDLTLSESSTAARERLDIAWWDWLTCLPQDHFLYVEVTDARWKGKPPGTVIRTRWWTRGPTQDASGGSASVIVDISSLTSAPDAVQAFVDLYGELLTRYAAKIGIEPPPPIPSGGS